MVEVKTFNPKSLFKVGFVFYLAVMLLVGVAGLVALLYSLVTGFSTTALAAAGGAAVIYLITALFYALAAACFMAVSGLVYNKIAKKFGGIKVEVEEIK